jgi:MOSC domain-containing protein YiiM
LEGDKCAHPKFHGGPNQAVLIVAGEVLDELRALGYPVHPGALGENLTTRGLDRRRFRAGQRFRIGQAIVELTKVRVPCATLDTYNSDGRRIQDAIYDRQVKAGDPQSPRWGMSGFYARVERTGVVRTNDIITLLNQLV